MRCQPGEDELAVALVALEGNGAIIRFGFGPSACYSLSQQLLEVTAITASADLAHAVAIDDHIMETSKPGNNTGCLRNANQGNNDTGARREEDSIVLIRRHVACKIPSTGNLLCAAETSRMRRAARKRSTTS
ncbi:hypothetical protein COCOBI_08-6060 [Coccomyxa sp. Obi]|nr:hypothetical protein COCOBI_08-6060 [Coccomyxa sp. Obi]